MAELVRCRVVGSAEVLGVSAPGEVKLDPGLYNIDALVSAGHVVVVAEDATEAPRTRRAAGAES